MSNYFRAINEDFGNNTESKDKRQKMEKFICGICGDYCSEYTYNEEKDVDECNNCKDNVNN